MKCYSAGPLKIYEKAVRNAMKHRKRTLLITAAMFVLVFVVYSQFNYGVEFFPDTDPREAVVTVTMPVGTNIEQTDRTTREIEKKIPALSDIKYIVTNVGSSNNPLDFSGDGIPTKSVVTINFIDKVDREQSSFITLEQIRKAIEDIPGGEIEIEKQQNGPPTGPLRLILKLPAMT
ncbi:MAG: efflux RND transporter permease subunit [Ignavibacteria bacterium]